MNIKFLRFDCSYNEIGLFISANYLDNWQCISVLKADSSSTDIEKSFSHIPSVSTTHGANMFR